MADPVQHILNAALAPPEARTLNVMRLSLIDWVAVGLAGTKEPVSQIVRETVLSEAGTGVATLFGGARAPARAAAYANGTTSHALDLDDTHFAHIGHPSVAVIPAALAIAEQENKSVSELLHAALAGCEASIRFGLLFGRAHYQTGFHQTATAGAFGAAVAASRLLSHDAEILRQALNIVSTRASGLKAQFGSMGKPLNAGIAASNGVEAALLAARGFVSSSESIDGPSGFLLTHQCDGVVATGQGFLMDQVSHKFHACCHGLHACLEALNTLGAVAVENVLSVEIQSHPRWLSVCNKASPQTGLEAKFSFSHVTALRLLGYDTARLDTFSDALCVDGRVITLREKVRVIGDDTLPETAARVMVTLREDQLTADYDLAKPQSYAERAEKLKHKVAGLIEGQKTERLWSLVHSENSELCELTELMR